MGSRIAPLVALALMSAPAAAQTAPPAPPAPTEQTPPPKAHQEGDYGGVKPGEPQKTDSGKVVRHAAAGTLAWVGFSASDGVGHVFLQAGSEIGYTQSVEGKVIVVHLTGVKRLGRQVRRPLEARYFDSPVARITVAKVRARRARKKQPAQKAGVEVRIALKDVADAHEASARTAVEADGYFYIYLDVAPSSPAKTN